MLRGSTGTEQPPDFRREDPLVTRHVARRVPDAALGLAKAVIRRRVDVTHPGPPSRAHNSFGLSPADFDPTSAEGRAAETQRRDLKRRASDPAFLERLHRPALFHPCPLDAEYTFSKNEHRGDRRVRAAAADIGIRGVGRCKGAPYD